MPRSCFSCTTNLTYGRYYSKDGHSYCTNCYEAQFCLTCVLCNQKIIAGQRGLTWRNTAWHDTCFTCTQCNVSLIEESSSLAKKNRPYCSNCYNQLFSPKCNKCGKVIESGTSWLNVKLNKLHPHCFTCSQCNISLANQTHYEHNGDPYCADCDNRLFCPKCACCGEVIRRGITYLKLNGQMIHKTCFTCFGCGQMIESYYQKKNGHNYHSHCVDNTYVRERRTSFHGISNTERTVRNETDRRPFEDSQQTVSDPFTIITPLNLRSSTAKRNTRLQRSTTNLPNLLNKVVQSNNDVLPSTLQELSSNIPENNFYTENRVKFSSQISERSRTAGARRYSVVEEVKTQQEPKNETTKDLSQFGHRDEDFEQQTRSRSSLRRASIPSHMVQKKMTTQIDNSNSLPPKPAPRKTRTCQVCYEEKLVVLYSHPISEQCRHRERTICNECNYQNITQAFQKMCRDDVRCPELDCKIILNYDAIKRILLAANDTILFQRYDRFYLEHQLEGMPDFIWCAHGCGSGQLVDNGVENNIVTCAKCRKKSCFNHRTKWHEGLTCAHYDAQTDPGKRATEQWLAQKTKNCPKCRSAIEKTSGCDHMTCAQCHFEFCWACLANYESIRQHGNHYHQRRCKHFRPYEK